MNMVDAVKSVLTQYAGFSGRARRSEYWWFVLAYVIVGIVFGIIDGLIKSQIPTIILSLALLVPSLAVTVRRLHDIDRSGFWIFIGLVPFIGGIVLLVFACLDSKPGTNQWGPSPKYAGAGGVQGQFGGPGGYPAQGWDQQGGYGTPPTA